ncbi:PspC domain-containing protein [Sunxiuqinia indica]|uniref:PspC domain-containing protein n=1 Tax=Sunxiuqinia indica TaxID=2692584 RepID=UPI001357AC4C|nr:PspC domain-containing protein [Sunxiuqinia indica]
MKKTFTINISGSVFHIDEDAYQKLQNYLQMLNQHFGPNEEGREILQDIETRIAELFNEKMEKGDKNVIQESWVDEVMARMGKPEDFMEGEIDEDETEETGTKAESKTHTTTGKTKRRMYRDPDSRVFGGVCGGMGAYFGIDPVILRIITFILIFVTSGVIIPVYLLLWIAVPKARTTAQKLEMRGQEATVSNIEKSIKEEVDEVKASYKKFKSSDSYNKGRENAGRFGDVLYSILRVSLKVLIIIFGVLMILFGFISLITFLTSMIVGHSFMEAAPWIAGIGPEFYVPGIANYFISPGSLTILLIAIGFLVGIPLLGILFIGTKMVFRYNTNNKVIFLGTLGVWLVALVTVIVVSLAQVDNYSKQTTVTESNKVECDSCQTLYLNLADDNYSGRHNYYMDLDRMKVITENGETTLLGRPRLDVERSNTDDFVILVRKKSRGASSEEAKDNVQEIVYQYQLNDSTIYFDPYYRLADGSRWLQQEVDITVKVPENKRVYLGDELVKIIYDIENTSNTWDGDMAGKYWKMTELGLQEDSGELQEYSTNN